jgi:NitT/TauT family transport system ATP-binding protein
MMDLSDAAEKYPAELSGGMQQRVSIARALALDPDLLILDEPFKAMDETLQNRVIQVVNQTGAAILLVTHDKSHADALGCKLLLLSHN